MSLKAQLKYITAHDELILKKLLSPRRFIHSVNTAKLSLLIARKFGFNSKKAELAGFLHDCAKELPDKELINLMERTGAGKEKNGSRALWHAFAGPSAAKKYFNISDPEILEAIECHTAGKKGMGIIAKIVYAADYIELSRAYKGAARIRKLLFRNDILPEHLVFEVLTEKLSYLISRGIKVNDNAIEMYNWIAQKELK